jgi:hypothetical protein
MRPDPKLISIGAVAFSWVIPFLTIGVLAVIARFWKVDLSFTLRWMRGFRWTGWFVGISLATVGVGTSLATVGVGSHRGSTCFIIGLSIAGASAGLAIFEGRVKRRYASESLPPKSSSNSAA